MTPAAEKPARDVFPAQLRRVYWETTASCNLRCIHCRRPEALARKDPEELDAAEGLNLIDQLADAGKPVLIFSGGEPLFRRDLFALMARARGRGLPVALATNGTLIEAPLAGRLKDAGVYYASISLDGATAEVHDAFRGAGNFERALRGLRAMQAAGIKVQVNFTVTRRNVHELEAVHKLVRDVGGFALYLFLLVPVGCGVALADSEMLGEAEVERWLATVSGWDRPGALPVKAICAPHYYRVRRGLTSAREPIDEERKGCLAGIHMCFVSHKGDVYPCGYLPLSAGNVRKQSFKSIWEDSGLFSLLRDPGRLQGRCGACEYQRVCGGCRARGLAAYGDFLAQEPDCAYLPPGAAAA